MEETKMVKHIILWQLAEEYKTEEIKKGIKEGLESLQGKIPGMIDIHVQIDCLESSNADALLIACNLIIHKLFELSISSS